jgi:hypothetical protein
MRIIPEAVKPATTHENNTRSCTYSLDAPDDEQNMQSSQGTINYTTQLHLVGHFYKLFHFQS